MTPFFDTTPVQSILSDINTLSFDDRFDPESECEDYTEFLDRNPKCLDEILTIIQSLPGGANPERIVALYEWAKGVGMSDIHLVKGAEQDDLNIRYRYDYTLEYLLPTQSTQYLPLSSEVSETARNEMLEIERVWMLTGTTAPVVVVQFNGEQEDDRGELVPYDTYYCRWDCVDDFILIPLKDRNGYCRRNTNESDNLIDLPNAMKEAQEWGGPFCVEATLYKPGQALLALKEAAFLRLFAKQAQPSLSRAPRL